MNRFNTKGKRTYNVSDVIVGDIVKFKGTRNGGIRRVLKVENVYGWSGYAYEEYIRYFCQVLNQKMSGFSEVNYTSTNNVDKLSHVFRDGTWFKVIKD